MAGKRRKMGAREWLAIFIWIISCMGIVSLGNALQSTNFSKAFLDNLEVTVKGIPLLVGFLATLWLIVISRIFRRRRHAIFTWHLILLPVLIFAGWTIFSLPDPTRRFSQITGVELPSELEEFESMHEVVFLTGNSHIYSFRCSPAETTKLIENLGWRGRPKWSIEGPGIHKLALDSGLHLDLNSWSEPVVYSVSSKESWNYLLVTDQTRERVFIQLSQ